MRERGIIAKAVTDGIAGSDVWLEVCGIVDVVQVMSVARGENPVLEWGGDESDEREERE